MTSQGLLGQAVALLETLGMMPFIQAMVVVIIAFALWNYFIRGRD